MKATDRLQVVHSLPTWLPQTQAWLHTQLSHTPEPVESHVVCARTENLDQFPVSRLHSLSTSRACWLRLLPAAWTGVRQAAFLLQESLRCRADVIHSHFGDVGWVNRRIAPATGSKHAVSFYGQDATATPVRDPAWRGRYLELFTRVDCVFCEGPRMGRRLVALGCPQRKLRMLRLGVDLQKIAFRPRVWDGRSPLRILIAAAFREKKGIPYAVEALGRLQAQRSIEVTIVGDCTDEPRTRAEKEIILEAIGRNGLGSSVTVTGFLSHAALLNEANAHHVFVCPSVTASDGDSEGGLPVALIEMAASGMPVVATRHDDIPDLIQDGVDGLLVAERNVSELMGALEWLAQRPGAWRSLVESARRRVEADFDAAVQGRKRAGIYRSLCESKVARPAV